MKDRYKLVSFDIDGTLLPYMQEDFNFEIKDMFKRLKEAGMTVVFCTGREMITIGSLINSPYVDYFLGANGAFIYDVQNKKMIKENTIDYNEFINLYDFLTSIGVKEISVMTDKHGYFSPEHDFNNWFLKNHKSKFKWLEELQNDKDNMHIVTIKTSNPEIIKITDKYLKDNKFKMEVNSAWSKGFFIAPSNINKARGLENLGNILNIKLDEMIAFGDSSNDYEMLAEVGYGVAMGDSEEELKKLAKDTTTTAEEFGALTKLEELGII